MKLDERCLLTMIIPTRNRPQFLTRLLDYYASLDCRYQILIGDSSDGNFQTEIKRLEQIYSSRLRASFNYYPHDPTLGPGEEITKFVAKLLEQVETPYFVFHPDDELFVPRTLEKCVHFLENNSDYHLAHGVGVLVEVENGQPHGRVLGTSEYAQKSNEFPKAQDRFLSYMMGGGVQGQFSVKRMHPCRENWQLACQLGLDNFFEELFNNSLSAIQGKFKKIEGLYIIRQTHSKMKSRAKGFFDWLIHPSFSKNYNDFLKILTRELAKQDHLGEQDAQEIILKGFWFYFSNTAKRMWKGKYIQKSFQPRIKGIVGISMMNSVRKFIRSFLPSGKVMLPALLRSSSPFHSDFLPIYNAIANNRGQKSL